MPNGAQLEEAVKAIETAILQGEPLGERTLSIEGNKTLIMDGVRHEIDLYVQIKPGTAYDATYIFECKNWAEAIGKNEIIVFSEKIKVTCATRGFFVAPHFGEFARAQAKLDPRMVLLNSTEHHISPVGFRHIAWGNVQFTWRDVQGLSGAMQPKSSTPTIANGKPLPFAAIIECMGDHIIQTQIAQPDVAALADGSHQLVASVCYNLPAGEIVADSVSLSRLTIDAKFTYVVTTPKLIDGYDVKTRGMYLRFERIQIDAEHAIDGLTITAAGERPQA